MSRVLTNIDPKLSKKFVISSFYELQDLFLLSYENVIIDENEFLVLHEEFKPKNFSYEMHNGISLEEMIAEFSAWHNLKRPSILKTQAKAYMLIATRRK